jgi:hypothetical protein
MDPFGQEDSLRDDIIPTPSKSSKQIFIKKILIFAAILIVWIAIVVIELSIVFSSDDDEDKNNLEINCNYTIKEADLKDLKLINEKFENKTFDIYVDGEKYKEKKIQINKNGTYNIKFKINEENIDDIFNGIKTLNSVKIKSKNNLKLK